MITYDLLTGDGPLYDQLYQHIKQDIRRGKLVAKEKLPSKRMFAKNLGVSVVTVEAAYDQLMSEGYICSVPKKGFYVAELFGANTVAVDELDVHQQEKVQPSVFVQQRKEYRFDFSSNYTNPEYFPFSVWAKLMRETISMREHELLKPSDCGGVRELREAIAGHLASFRGMEVNPDQIIVGAGTEYLYGLILQLLGKDAIYCLENPGYQKIHQIYHSHGVRSEWISMDEYGICMSQLRESRAQVVHISPTHHFPTGITMPIQRRYELLSWANEQKDRYIIEDDYDSEFRLNGKPIPPLASIDTKEKVIYMNTFSKSLASTIRLSYMVLPPHLANKFYRELSFYSCTVSTFEQYTLAQFIRQGFFEKHINRLRLRYGKKRKTILAMFEQIFSNRECQVLENDSGLHFILELKTTYTDREVCQMLESKGIRILAITDYDMKHTQVDQHQFIFNYSNVNLDELENALSLMKKTLFP